MVDMYYRLVKAGLRTIHNVPDQFRDAVIENLTPLASSVDANQTSVASSVSDISNSDTPLNLITN
ncbi:MAG: CD1375 family protein [Clostridium sp.]|uniref:CD1375 family protein n=1 Tax=Clostridium sp. TaxID=1506 RepID=UPI003D6CE025